MEARATFRGARPAGAIATFIVALLAALLVGGAGGYLIRGLSVPAAAAPASQSTVRVVESPPYGELPSSAPSPSPYRTTDPSGRVITI
jgi:hypothetical protein